VPQRPSDFEVHRDGRLLITDPNRSVLHRCKLPAGPCEILDVGLKSVPGQEVLPLNAAKIHIDETAKRYYISDNYGYRFLIADFERAASCAVAGSRGASSQPARGACSRRAYGRGHGQPPPGHFRRFR
jgi:hypothetical protein